MGVFCSSTVFIVELPSGNICTLKPFISQDALITLVHAFVTPRIDYSSSLVYGIADYNINRLQRIQNGAARLATNNGKHSHVKIILRKLLWLPVNQRIHFKILITTYKCICGEAPKYLCDLLLIKKSGRFLRSSSQILLQVPVSRRRCYGDCAFSVAGPCLWNRLPESIKCAKSLEIFKSLLKTHLFEVAFQNLEYFLYISRR